MIWKFDRNLTLKEITVEKTQTTFVAAARDFFGYQPGQTLSGFNDEIKKLTPEDRKEISDGLRAVGYTFLKD